MEVKSFQSQLIDVTNYIYHLWKVVLNVVIKNKKTKYIRDRWLKGYVIFVGHRRNFDVAL